MSERLVLEDELRARRGHPKTRVLQETSRLTMSRAQIQTLLERLEGSEARFRAIFEQAPLGIALIDSVTGTIQEANERFVLITGWTRQELATQDWMRITQPDDTRAELENLARADAGGMAVIRMNQPYSRPDGSVAWINLTVTAAIGGADGSRRYLTLIEDVSGQQRLAEALIQIEERYRQVLDAISEGFWEADLINETLMVNEGWYSLLGYSREEVTPTYELFRRHLHPDDVEAYEQNFTEHLLGRSPHFECEYRIITKTGDLRWQQGFGKVLQRDREGLARRMVGALSDITARKRVEEALQEAEQRARNTKERMEQALNVSGLGLWEFRWDGRRMLFDERANRMLGYGAIDTDMKEIDWLRRVHPADRTEVELAMAQHEQGENPALAMEFRFRHQDGHWLWVQARGKITARDAAGNPSTALGTLVDISQQKRVLNETTSLLHRIEEALHQAARLPASTEASGSSEPTNPLDLLTSRQKEVLGFVASGLTSAQIAEKMQIAIGTVRAHRRDLMQTLGLHSAAEVTRFALREKLLAEE